jgi:homoserine kinase
MPQSQPSRWDCGADVTSAFRSVGVEVVVPATSANLGPGFDSLGLALALHDHLVAMVTEDPGVLVTVEGEGADVLPSDETHLVARAMAAAWEAMGLTPPGVVIRCRNAIPQGRGLGSSAAAIVAGLLLARGLVVDGDDMLPDDDLLGLATRMEGHPDNVAAALLGNFTTAWIDSTDDAHASAVTRAVHRAITPVIFVPQGSMPTSHARMMLSDSVDRTDAVFNVGRAALLAHALVDDPGLLFPATEDRLHQDARASAYPESHRLVVALREASLAAVISGAGPTVLAFTTDDDERAVATAAAPQGWRTLTVPVDVEGARVHIRGS